MPRTGTFTAKGVAPFGRSSIAYPTMALTYTYDVKNSSNIIDVFEGDCYIDIYVHHKEEFEITGCCRCYFGLPMLRQTSLSVAEVEWIKETAGVQNPEVNVSFAEALWSDQSSRYRFFKTRLMNFRNEDGDDAERVPVTLMSLPEPCHFKCLLHSAARAYLTAFSTDCDMYLEDINTRVANQSTLQTFMKKSEAFCQRVLDMHHNADGVEVEAWERGKVCFTPVTGLSTSGHFDQRNAHDMDLSIITDDLFGDVIKTSNAEFGTLAVDAELDISGVCVKNRQTSQLIAESLHSTLRMLQNENFVEGDKRVEVVMQLNVTDKPKSEPAAFVMRTSWDNWDAPETPPNTAGRNRKRHIEVVKKYGGTSTVVDLVDTPPKAQKVVVVTTPKEPKPGAHPLVLPPIDPPSPISTEDADAAAMQSPMRADVPFRYQADEVEPVGDAADPDTVVGFSP